MSAGYLITTGQQAKQPKGRLCRYQEKLSGVASIAISSIWAAPLIKFGKVVDNARRAAWEALTAEMRLNNDAHLRGASQH